MCCTGNDRQLYWCDHPAHCRLIHFDNRLIVTANDQQRWCAHERQGVAGEIRTSTPRDDSHRLRPVRGCDQSSCGAGARAEVADRQLTEKWVRSGPVGGGDDTAAKQWDVEPELSGTDVNPFLRLSQ